LIIYFKLKYTRSNVARDENYLFNKLLFNKQFKRLLFIKQWLVQHFFQTDGFLRSHRSFCAGQWLITVLYIYKTIWNINFIIKFFIKLLFSEQYTRLLTVIGTAALFHDCGFLRSHCSLCVNDHCLFVFFLKIYIYIYIRNINFIIKFFIKSLFSEQFTRLLFTEQWLVSITFPRLMASAQNSDKSLFTLRRTVNDHCFFFIYI
jgi:hypothetical protein